MEGILQDTEWRKNFRMDHDIFMKIANDLRPYLRPRRGPRGKDVLSVEKQLALTLYYLKDQGSLAMAANSFGVALCSVSVVVQKVYENLAPECYAACVHHIEADRDSPSPRVTLPRAFTRLE